MSKVKLYFHGYSYAFKSNSDRSSGLHIRFLLGKKSEHTLTWLVRWFDHSIREKESYLRVNVYVHINITKPSRRLQNSARYASNSLHLSIKNLVKSWRRSHGH